MKNFHKIIFGIVLGLGIAALLSSRTYARDSSGDIVVIVDPGHGGNDGGAASAYDKESDLNWHIAQALKAELETYDGVKVYLTRGSAEWNSNTARGRLGAQLGADLFVSVHNNSGADVSGVEVYGTVNAAYKADIQRLCEMVADKVSSLGLVNRGYRARGSTDDPSVDFYTMLDEAVKCGIPGLVIEHCYLNNAGDAAFINNPENQIKCGIADATAIAQYYGLSKRGVAAGSEMTLLRTYSACMTGNITGTYSSSDTSVAYVSPEGVITAVGEGTAVIKCTGADGNSESVTIKVPAVSMIGIAAGINPTFYSDPAAASAYDKSTVMVKAIYSDGHVQQLSDGFTLGDFPSSANGIFDVPVSYGGFSCPLRIYGIGGYLGNYSKDNYKVIGTNADVLLYPPVYNGINTGIPITTGGSMQAGGTVVMPTEPPAPAPTEPPAPAPTEPPAPAPTEPPLPEPTEPPVTEPGEDITEIVTEEETETETEIKTEAPTEAVTEKKTEAVTEKETSAAALAANQPKRTVWFYVAIGATGVAIAAAVACIVYLVIRMVKNKNHGTRR